ncbi:methyltransferase-like protein [Trypanosoma conorhini]|uniref:Methyltransferase-like protein n=1 Tax=Trypanosoma conorhini TaxID=83891 RepID=A0A422NF53_9TRYP|nr:methyltransferase-like protein [Trypanosoma conorhini]RNF04090.1 methyltransferase-like protein [Trypanosoma conorhini]
MPPPRPEFENPPDVLYNKTGASRYTSSTRVQLVQRAMTVRALELLGIPPGRQALLLDIGCGSGISGDVLRATGHTWVGVDISNDMLMLAKESQQKEESGMGREEETHSGEQNGTTGPGGKISSNDLKNVKWGLITESDDDNDEESNEGETADALMGPSMVEVLRGDMGQGLPFRPGSFDGAVSISAVQWLCQSDCRGHVPQRRLRALFQSLYNALHRGAKAALQFYPSNVEQVHMITRAAMLCGFTGGVVVDFPHSAKAKKHYLVIQAGQVAGGFVPRLPIAACATDGEEEEEDEGEEAGEMESEAEFGDDNGDEQYTKARVGGRVRAKHSRSHNSGPAGKRRRKDNRPVTGSKDWVLLKKAERRKFGLPTTEDSKYTMRRRRPRF